MLESLAVDGKGVRLKGLYIIPSAYQDPESACPGDPANAANKPSDHCSTAHSPRTTLSFPILLGNVPGETPTKCALREAANRWVGQDPLKK